MHVFIIYAFFTCMHACMQACNFHLYARMHAGTPTHLLTCIGNTFMPCHAHNITSALQYEFTCNIFFFVILNIYLIVQF